MGGIWNAESFVWKKSKPPEAGDRLSTMGYSIFWEEHVLLRTDITDAIFSI